MPRIRQIKLSVAVAGEIADLRLWAYCTHSRRGISVATFGGEAV